jgi:hypothetical protein
MVELPAEVVVDASGQATFLANRGPASPKLRGGDGRQAAFFSQVTGAARLQPNARPPMRVTNDGVAASLAMLHNGQKAPVPCRPLTHAGVT